MTVASAELARQSLKALIHPLPPVERSEAGMKRYNIKLDHFKARQGAIKYVEKNQVVFLPIIKAYKRQSS